MSDKYPGIVRGTVDGQWFRTVHPTHKVVPLDAIVIEPSPEVVKDGQYVRCGDEAWYPETATPANLDGLERHVREVSALIAHFRANPPVDEAEVGRVLAAVESSGLGEEWADSDDRRNFARRLYARGVRVTEDGAR